MATTNSGTLKMKKYKKRAENTFKQISVFLSCLVPIKKQKMERAVY